MKCIVNFKLEERVISWTLRGFESKKDVPYSFDNFKREQFENGKGNYYLLKN